MHIEIVIPVPAGTSLAFEPAFVNRFHELLALGVDGATVIIEADREPVGNDFDLVDMMFVKSDENQAHIVKLARSAWAYAEGAC